MDAVLVGGERREQVYTLTRADRVYRQIITTMSESAATVSAQGAMVGRELRMIELKQEINELCRRLGEPPRHATDQFQTDRIPGAGPVPPGGGDA